MIPKQWKLFAADVIHILQVDNLKEENCLKHHTEKYVHKNLIIRRAAKFDLKIYFNNRAYNSKKDKIVLEFSIGMS